MSGAVFAHSAGGGALPAPPWLLSYIGVFAVLLTVVGLRANWSATRLARFAPDEPATDADVPSTPSSWTALGQTVGVLLLAGVFVASIVGPDENAANIAPVAVLVMWRVGLPILALLLGDVMGAINPFVGIVRVIERFRTPSDDVSPAPSWVPAAFLSSFSWFWLAYHSPGSPRSVLVFLAIYTVAAVSAGLRWGSSWLRTGEGFGALSAAIARLSPLGTSRSVGGVTALMVVWVGGTMFDGLTNTPFWGDVVGTSTGWAATALDTVGFVWMAAVAGGVVLLAFRLTDRMGTPAGDDLRDGRSLMAAGLGVALVPLATGWFIAHDITLLLSEGQNFLALISDPLGKGWDLFGTINRTIDYGIFRARWIRWVQLLALAVGHMGAVVVAHDVAIRLVGRRRGMASTWAIAFVAGTSVVAAVLLVLK